MPVTIVSGIYTHHTFLEPLIEVTGRIDNAFFLQINFFEDHTKIILCPLMGAVTYIDEKRNFKTYRLASLEKVRINYLFSAFHRIYLFPNQKKFERILEKLFSFILIFCCQHLFREYICVYMYFWKRVSSCNWMH